MLGLLLWGCKNESLTPVIDSISPEFGPIETLVTIQGENLSGIQTITFSGQIVNFNTAYNADHAFLLRIPENIPLGLHEVILSTEKGEVTTSFTVTNEPPEIFRVNPESAAPGESVTIFGENFFEPIEVYFFDSVQAQVTLITLDSLHVVVPEGVEKGPVQVVANGGNAFSPKPFFTIKNTLINDFDGGGERPETAKWIFQGSIEQTAQNAVQQTTPAPISGNYLKLSGMDEFDITWVGGTQSNFGFPGDDFENFGLTTTANNTLLEFDAHNNGRDQTHLLIIFNENEGSPNDFSHTIKLDDEGWERISIPLNRFKDLTDNIVDPTKIKLIKLFLMDEDDSNGMLEVNLDNLEFVQIL